MAKPGSTEAAALASMSRRAADLRGRVALPPAVAERIAAEAEKQLGMRCGGCGRRISVGLKFTRLDVVAGEKGRPTVDVQHLAACNGAEGCDYAAKARKGADVMEMVEFVWLFGEPPVGGDESLEEAVERVQAVAEEPAADPT